MPTVLRVVRGAMAIVIVVALVDQFFRGTDNPTFNGMNFFSYFTVLSNISAVVMLGALALRPALVGVEPFAIFRGAVTLYMTITGIIYNVLLAPAQADVSTNLEWVNLIVHVIGPIVVILDWFLNRSPIRPTIGQAATWLIFPAIYLVYTMVRGPLADWYPYPFLDPNVNSVGYIIGMTLGVVVTFLVIGVILWLWSGPRRHGRRVAVTA